MEAWFKIICIPPSKSFPETHPSQLQEASVVEMEPEENVEIGKGIHLQRNSQNDDQDEIIPFDSILNKGSAKHGKD